MSEIHLFVLHPTTGTRARIRADDSLTPDEVVDGLISRGFVERSESGYRLVIHGGPGLAGGTTLSSASVSEGDVLQLSPVAEARGRKDGIAKDAPELQEPSASPGAPTGSDRLTIEEIQPSPADASLLIYRLEDL